MASGRGIARMPWNSWSGGKSSARKPYRSSSWFGNSRRSMGMPLGASARAVRPSLPGARPIPRSMRPGCSVSSSRNASATLSAL